MSASTTSAEKSSNSSSGAEQSDELSFPDLLARKRDGLELSDAQVSQVVRGVTDGSLGDEQLGAFLMAVYLRGMTDAETTALTSAMLHSGRVLSWAEPAELRSMSSLSVHREGDPSSSSSSSSLASRVVDKHSTGGVGDKVSIPLAPALAACGVVVPMVSGRGLGHTGGTLDKLESIAGYRVALSEAELRAQIASVGCAICGQTGDIAPADRRMYAVRDVTATVASVPLITSSIMSKKAAISPAVLVLDVKVGRAAFMQTEAEARVLARSMLAVNRGLGIRAAAALTRMDAPLGRAIGNSLEIAESVRCLRGEGPVDLEHLVCVLGGLVLQRAGRAPSAERGAELVRASLHDGSALTRFRDMVQAQGGDVRMVDDLSLLPAAEQVLPLVSERAGYVADLDALRIAKVALELGAGRKRKEDQVDFAVGVLLRVQVGQRIEAEQPWIDVHHQGNLTAAHIASLQAALTLQDEPCAAPDPVIDV
eukprot:CAMPEP_0174236234 /NCGR_PEP_ID=MMETSP0417-20130205/5426_1 /TAXON_ID=242541 /ORGANISM="Mayorella sp, Strain BSH-02190019" /LENGTH=480 /DNA_ID=CAMNT_0015314845 /DNA_START=40 /DNA_END=1478 /DNA_ORIENTATION=+